MGHASEISNLLREAAKMVDSGQPDRAAWRAADAGGLLRRYLEATGPEDLEGFDKLTGRGFVLPARAGTCR